MKIVVKNTLLDVLAIIFSISIVSSIFSPNASLFMVPRGGDYQVGEAIGNDIIVLMELVIIGFAIKRNFFCKNSVKH